MLGGSSARQEHKPGSVLLSLPEKITRAMRRLQEHCLEASPSSFLRSPLLLQDEEVLFGVGHLPGSGAVGSWHCHRGSAGGVPAKGLLPWLQPSAALPGFGVVPPARAVGRTEIQLVLLIRGVTGPARVGLSAAVLGNFWFRTKPLCWLGELEPCQGG